MCEIQHSNIGPADNSLRTTFSLFLFSFFFFLFFLSFFLPTFRYENIGSKVSFGRREWNGMERNEKNNFKIFFSSLILGF